MILAGSYWGGERAVTPGAVAEQSRQAAAAGTKYRLIFRHCQFRRSSQQWLVVETTTRCQALTSQCSQSCNCCFQCHFEFQFQYI